MLRTDARMHVLPAIVKLIGMECNHSVQMPAKSRYMSAWTLYGKCITDNIQLHSVYYAFPYGDLDRLMISCQLCLTCIGSDVYCTHFRESWHNSQNDSQLVGAHAIKHERILGDWHVNCGERELLMTINFNYSWSQPSSSSAQTCPVINMHYGFRD